MMIIGLIEHDLGTVSKLSLEMLTWARNFAQTVDAEIGAVIIGDDVYDMAEDLAEYGVSKAWVFEEEKLSNYAPSAWATCAMQVIAEENPQALLASGTDRGNEVLAHIGARLGISMTANVTEAASGDDFQVTRVRWGGSLLEEATIPDQVKLMTIAPLILEPEPADEEADIEIEECEAELQDNDLQVQLVSREVPESVGISLSDAKIVISGGRGVGSAEGFNSLANLANEVDGAVGCSRAVTNNGWRPHADQIGQTGNRVAPDLYIACGISGASQHMAGCAASKKIMVINTDKDAPILSRADYAIIGDLHEVLPAIANEVKAIKRNR